MARIRHGWDAWPESSADLLSIMERFERLRMKHARELSLSLTIFCVPTSSAEIGVVLKADDKLDAAGNLLVVKLEFWS